MTEFANLLVDDAKSVFLTDFAETVTLGGVACAAIVVDDFENADPRAPELRVATVDLDGVAIRSAVIVRGVTYAIEFIRPGRFGLSTIGLQK